MTWSFCIGSNIRYDSGELSGSDINADLALMQQSGMTVARVFVGNSGQSDQAIASDVDSFLTTAEQYGISVIVCLADYYAGLWHPQSMDGDYNNPNKNCQGCLGDGFWAGDYKNAYKSYVNTVVSANAHHPNVFAWELGNEMKATSGTTATTGAIRPDLFLAFSQDMASFIKGIDPSHRVSPGIISVQNISYGPYWTPDQYYSQVTDIDVVTVHDYNQDHSGAPDIQWAKANGKVAMIEEGLACRQMTPNPTLYNSELSYWQSQGIDYFLQWRFLATSDTDPCSINPSTPNYTQLLSILSEGSCAGATTGGGTGGTGGGGTGGVQGQCIADPDCIAAHGNGYYCQNPNTAQSSCQPCPTTTAAGWVLRAQTAPNDTAGYIGAGITVLGAIGLAALAARGK